MTCERIFRGPQNLIRIILSSLVYDHRTFNFPIEKRKDFFAKFYSFLIGCKVSCLPSNHSNNDFMKQGEPYLVAHGYGYCRI